MRAEIGARGRFTRMDWLLPSAALVIAVTVPLLVYATVIFRSPSPLPFLLDDDAFYYLTIARNIAAGLGSTFDGIGATNGYHPVWLAILVPLAAIAPSDEWLVASVYWINGLLWMAAVALVLAIGRQLQLGRHALFALPILVWYGATWGGRGHHLFWTGVEIGLTVVLLLALAWAILRADLYGSLPSRRAATGVGVLLGLLILTRLDTVFIAVTILGALPLSQTWRLSEARARWGAALHIAVPVGAALVIYAALNLAIVGTPLAVSGQAKSIGAPWFARSNLRNILLHGFFQKAPFFSGALLVPLSILAAWVVPDGCRRDTTWRAMVLALAAGFVLQAFAWWATYAPEHLRSYYFYVTPVLASVALPHLFKRIEERLELNSPLPSAAAAAAALLLACAVLWPQEWRRGGATVPSGYLEHTRQTSAWLREHLPPGTRYAMADHSGIMGFLLKRPVFQLEGLVNTPDYLRDLAAGRVDNLYLLDRGIDVFILSERGERPRDVQGCIIAPAREGGPIQPRLRLCADNLLWRAEFSDATVTVWRLSR